jgi:hypothetical protein
MMASAARDAGDGGQGCSYFAQLKQEPNDDYEQDYAVAMYRRLGLGCGQF